MGRGLSPPSARSIVAEWVMLRTGESIGKTDARISVRFNYSVRSIAKGL